MLSFERGPFATVVIASSFVLTGLHGRTPGWASALTITALLVVVTVRLHGRTADGWVRAALRYRLLRAARARAHTTLPDTHDIEVPAGTCGIAGDGAILLAMIQLAPNLDLPTVVAESTTYTEDTVRVSELADLLDQFGLAVDIDVVTTGRRVRPIGNYGLLYDQLIGGHSVVGDRITWLVLRLDAERNLTTLASRGAAAEAAPRALAAAAIRIAARLRETGVAAQVLPANELTAATRHLHDSIEPDQLKERWSRLIDPVSRTEVASYWVDLPALGDSSLDECWSCISDRTTMVVSLAHRYDEISPYSELALLHSRSDNGPQVELRAVVRYTGTAVRAPALSWLRPLHGRQSEALRASLPTAATLRTLGVGLELTSDSPSAGLSIPIGPSGQIMGSISGQPRHTLAVPLYDPARYRPRRRMIDAHVELSVAQQLVLRAAVVGADIEIRSNRPDRWRQLVNAVGDPTSVRLARDDGTDAVTTDGDLTPPTVVVFDGLAPSATTAHTTIAISEPGAPTRPSAHVTISQIDDRAVTIGLPMGTVRVDLIEPMGEARYLDAGRSTTGPAAVAASADPLPVPRVET